MTQQPSALRSWILLDQTPSYFFSMMSHYPLLVLGSEPDRQLDPYWTEGCDSDPKWDWCEPGGRYAGLLSCKTGTAGTDQAFAGTIDWQLTRRRLLPFAVLLDGEWHERGEVEDFGLAKIRMSLEEWNKMLDQLLLGLPEEMLVSLYDCHL